MAVQTQNKMVALGKQTKAGLFFPTVQIPSNLDGFRTQMLISGNEGRHDPDFRKKNGSATATDLSGDQTKTKSGNENVH